MGDAVALLAEHHAKRQRAREHTRLSWAAEDAGDVHLARRHELEATRLRLEADRAYWRAMQAQATGTPAPAGQLLVRVSPCR